MTISTPLLANEQQINLKIAMVTGNAQTPKVLDKLARQFERQNPQIKINFIEVKNSDFKPQIAGWLEKPVSADIISWHANERLFKFVRQDLILDVSDIWQTVGPQFPNNFLRHIKYQQNIYAIPYSYYQWGFYYKKSLFKRLNISPPKNWQQLLNMLEQMNKVNITPIAIGSFEPWAVSCWFEYLNLRLNGLQYHNSFVRGEISAHDHGIKQVFMHLQQLIELNAFADNANQRSIRESLPTLYREKAGITLEGSFIEGYIPDQFKHNIGFFEFPIINPQVENIQVSPIDILLIAKHTRHPNAAKQFLQFMASADSQTIVNQMLYQVPANIHAKTSSSNLLSSVVQSLA
ncbi:ABC transporter substrate-binding protein [Catenovulum agarivorans]|uniref:ABC transporter substrate-binding protein n=1 Tax=Catenovulum agarivorans TaxID=1172192 RepID=UPI0002FF0F32|nr:extracellular solute-binding protein [Catenovulum agarivorans]